MKPSNPSFVADGEKRASQGAKGPLKELRMKLENELCEKYASAMAEAGMIGRLRLRLKMKSELRKALSEASQKMAPRDGLY